MIENKRQERRYTHVHSGLKWQSLQRLAAGCQGDYIASSNQRSSLRIPQAFAPDTATGDVMETGLPVLFYNPKSKTFQNRVVKVDKQLSFFFVLEERQLKQPVAVRLYEIDEVLSGSQAFEILAEFHIQDDLAKDATTTVIIHTRASKETTITLDKLLILLAPPAMKLHEHILECVDLSKSKFSADAGDEQGVRLKDSGRYLDCARIGSCGAVFFHYATGVDLEFTLRPADVIEKQDFETKQPITHALHFPMDAANVGTEIEKLVERLGVLPALDLTRLKLVVYEMVLHRQWISPNIRLFPGGMYDFMQDQGGISAVFKVPIELRQRLYEGVQAPRRKMDVHHYSHWALDATILALKHLLSLEDVHQPLEELRKAMEELEKGERFAGPAARAPRVPREELLEKLRSAEVSTEPEEILQRIRARRTSGVLEEHPTSASRNSFFAFSDGSETSERGGRDGRLSFSDEGETGGRRRFSSDFGGGSEVTGRRRLSSDFGGGSEVTARRRLSSDFGGGSEVTGRRRLSSYHMISEPTEVNLASSRRSSDVEGEVALEITGRRRLSSHHMMAETTERVSYRSREASEDLKVRIAEHTEEEEIHEI